MIDGRLSGSAGDRVLAAAVGAGSAGRRERERGKFKPEAEDTRCCPLPIGLEEWQGRPAESCLGRVSRAPQKLPRGLRAAAGVLLWQLARFRSLPAARPKLVWPEVSPVPR